MIKWGIIAPGAIARAFAEEINETGNSNLIAVYGRNEERTKKFAEEYKIDNYYTDIEKFLGNEEIDAVYIATPHNYHMEYAVKCIESKKNVLCEKPFSYNYETSKKVIEMAKKNNVFIMEALWTLFLPAVKKAKEWIEEGRIGRINLITANFGFKSEEDFNSRLYNPSLAGGALLDVGIYTILISNYLTGQYPSEISSKAIMTKSNVDETDCISLKYGEETLASLTCSISSQTDNTAVIYGEKGKVVIPYFWSAKEAYLEEGDSKESFKDSYEKAGYKYEIIEAAQSIMNKEIENKVASHNVTLELAKIMDEVRCQIGLRYPFE